MKTLLGGKGANCGEMAKVGLSVPPGFTITTQVFKREKLSERSRIAVLEHDAHLMIRFRLTLPKSNSDLCGV
jgi:pyruvate,orthophosphate dikinase